MSDTDPFDAKMMEAGILPPPDSPPEPAATEPPPEAASSSQETETPEAPEFAAPELPAEGLIFGKFKNLEEAEKAYKEAERWGHEQAQRAAEHDRQQKEWADLQQTDNTPAWAQESEWNSEQLAGWEAYAMQGAQQAQEVLVHALNNQDTLGFQGQQFINQICGIYESYDKLGYQRFAYEYAAQPQIQQQQELVQHQSHQAMLQAIDIADARVKQELPDYERWAPLVGEWLQHNPEFVAGFVNDTSPEKMFKALSVAYHNARSEYALKQYLAAQQAAQAAPPAPGTKTQTKSSAAKPTDDSPDRAFARSIIEADF